MKLIEKYFTKLTDDQIRKFSNLKPLYEYWNKKINVISRKDINELYERHVLHSLAISKIIYFKNGTTILDVGTGGGFPGIPLAIMFPFTNFQLIDSIGKKIKVVNSIISELDLKNVEAINMRVQEIKKKYDFIISRAVTNLPDFLKWTKNLISHNSIHSINNGIIYLKGGDFDEELNKINQKFKIYSISDYFSEDFFKTKRIIHIYL